MGRRAGGARAPAAALRAWLCCRQGTGRPAPTGHLWTPTVSPARARVSPSNGGVSGTQPERESTGLGNTREDVAAMPPARPRPLASTATHSPPGQGAHGGPALSGPGMAALFPGTSRHIRGGACGPRARRPALQMLSRLWNVPLSVTAAQARGPADRGHGSRARTLVPWGGHPWRPAVPAPLLSHCKLPHPVPLVNPWCP